MYRDAGQWSDIRNRILRKGASIRQVARETGVNPKTVRKMLDHPLPRPYGPRSRRYPKLGPHTASIRRMLRENATLPPPARLSVKAIHERIRDEEGFRGSYGSVKDYARRHRRLLGQSRRFRDRRSHLRRIRCHRRHSCKADEPRRW